MATASYIYEFLNQLKTRVNFKIRLYFTPFVDPVVPDKHLEHF